jgi:ABC-type branched-subunit amino acid transport system substrate-binding protein
MALVLAAATSLPAAPAGAAASDVLVFGMSAPFSGPAGIYGQQMRAGIDACFSRVNAAGGVHGKRLQLVAMDDGYVVETAVANARQLIDKEKVFALMAFYGSSPTAAVLPELSRTGVPLIGTISGAEALRRPAHPQMFHLRASYGDETAAIVQNLVTVGITRVAVVYQDDGFGQAGLKGVKDALALNRLEIVAAAPIRRNSVDVASAVAAIGKANAQAVVMVTLSRATAEFIRQARKAGTHPFFVALSPVGTDQLIEDLGPAQARGIQVTQVIPLPSSDRLEVVREYKQAMATHARHAALSYYGLEGYLNAKLVVAALERAGANPSREKLVSALRSGPFDLGGYKVNYAPGSNSGSNYVEVSVVGQQGRILN